MVVQEFLTNSFGQIYEGLFEAVHVFCSIHVSRGLRFYYNINKQTNRSTDKQCYYSFLTDDVQSSHLGFWCRGW